jgi:hypothetical protein
MAFRHLETSLNGLKDFFGRPVRRLWDIMVFRLLKTSLKRLNPSRFFEAQDGEIEFQWPFDTLKHRIIDFTKVVFKTVRRYIMSSRVLKKSLLRHRPKRFFEILQCRKCYQISFPHHEITLHRHYQSRTLRRSQGRLWALRAIRLLKKNHLSNFVQIAFFNAQNVENAFEWPLYVMKNRFIHVTKVEF